MLPIYLENSNRLKRLLLFGVCLLLLTQVISFQALAFFGNGGFYSEKLIERSGITTGDLVIGRAGVAGDLMVGMAPRVQTDNATLVGITGGVTSAVLTGQVLSLNGFPSAEIKFEWGYTPALGNTVGESTVGAIGVYTHTLTGFAMSVPVYYRFDSGTDGWNYGEIQSFEIASGATPSLRFMVQALPLVYVGVGILFVVMLIGLQLPLLVSVVLGAILSLVGVSGVVAILNVLNLI